MAKGWESKSVEAQMEDAANHVRRPQITEYTPAEIELLRRKDSLVTSRTRVVRELQGSINPRHQAMLQNALKDLDARIAALQN
jgi:hypothetical protein